MSATLLQKSLKLNEENKGTKKKNLKKKRIQNATWRITREQSGSKEKEAKDNILNNIHKLKALDKPVSLDISDKIIARRFKLEVPDSKNPEEEKTVFTDKDFEEFEKEYFAS